MPHDRPVQRMAVRGIGAVAAVAVAAGLVLSGGPARGRMERRDEARREDLSRISQLIACRAGTSGRLPPHLSPSETCPGPVREADPFTGERYRVEPLANGSYRLCAGFELPPPAVRDWPDRDGDCLVFDLPGPSPVQVVPSPAG
ncbi:hypothetical protein [Paracoccus aeridis]|uniref:hypothetical protein n=1 Tax=Paracoccus aeridis TaxID=1966466 RepID=UPI0010AA658F|nr:hypothetical protein [Paracoccus aeridis]